MVLTGKQSLDYSGGVSAEDNFGIGGYDRVMGPNGEAQYWAPNLTAACDDPVRALRPRLRRAGRAVPASGADQRPARTATCGPSRTSHPDSDFTTVGDIFSAETNPDRKKPFDIRTVMRAVVDQDHAILERWAGMADADTSVVLDAHLGGYPVSDRRHRVADHRRARVPAGRRPGPVDRGHAVPAVVEEDGPGDQRRQRQPAAGGAGEPVRLRRLAGVAAQHPARVRRRDRPGHRQLRRPDRVLRRLPLPRWRVRGVLRSAERQHGGRRRRGLVRLGHRRRPRRGRGVHPGRQHPDGQRPAGSGSWRPNLAGAENERRAGPAAGRAWRAAGRGPVGEARRGGRRVRAVHNIERARGSAPSTPSSRPSNCVRTSSMRSSAACAGRSKQASSPHPNGRGTYRCRGRSAFPPPRAGSPHRPHFTCFG